MRVTGINTGIGLPHKIGHSNAWKDYSVNDSVAFQSRKYLDPIRNERFTLRIEESQLVQYYEQGQVGLMLQATWIEDSEGNPTKAYYWKPLGWSWDGKNPLHEVIKKAIEQMFPKYQENSEGKREYKTSSVKEKRKELVKPTYDSSATHLFTKWDCPKELWKNIQKDKRRANRREKARKKAKADACKNYLAKVEQAKERAKTLKKKMKE